MKSYLLLAAVFVAGLAGCATEPAVSPPRPFVGILSAEKIGTGPRETSSYNVVVIYENAVPEKSEVKIGFGYSSPELKPKKGDAKNVGTYATSHSEVLHDSKGELHLTIDPSPVIKAGGVMDGKIHAIISEYPHGEEWKVISHNELELQPD
jgi:hypothetical protein